MEGGLLDLLVGHSHLLCHDLSDDGILNFHIYFLLDLVLHLLDRVYDLSF